ncbi:hypothetical protein SpCBS45565_g05531 [Spizellomyces sp. 'palustris']|nr:hypothetical protein SpCBS45565_g05531 [Spizellomyces sp. 'palustris']
MYSPVLHHTHRHAPPPPAQNWSHRHYNPPHPTASKLLSKKWEDKSRSLHLKKIKEAKSTIDSRPPRVWPHLEVRLKRVQVEQERLQEIERNNHILLDRIAFQLDNPSEVSDLKSSQRPPSHRGSATSVNSSGSTRSLHAPKRKRDLKAIEFQNMTILQRIEDQPPTYPRTKFFASRCQNLEYLRNIAQYPQTYERLLEGHVGRHRRESSLCVHEDIVLPPPGKTNGRPPTRPNRMLGPLEDLVIEDVEDGGAADRKREEFPRIA